MKHHLLPVILFLVEIMPTTVSSTPNHVIQLYH